jgi:hypothetical protein
VRSVLTLLDVRAAFHPEDTTQTPHPIFPEGVSELTMFADYRVPQILNRLQVITYPETLISKLKEKKPFLSGSREEISIRSASILAVEEIRKEIQSQNLKYHGSCHGQDVNSVLIDFWLWDTSKKIENEKIDLEIPLNQELPTHRTRCIWY